MLTSKQHELLLFVHRRLSESGISPSFDEMKEALGLKSKSGIHRLISALEERGFIRKLANRARAIEVLRLPESGANLQIQALRTRGFAPEVIEGYRDRQEAMPESEAPPVSGRRPAGDVLSIPVMGRIAAGVPIEAIQARTRSLALPSDMLGPGDHFALEVRGDSMVNAGILDGDLAIVQRSENAESGEIVVALVDDEEATLKRLRKKGDTVALEAANAAYETQIYGASRIRIQGRLVLILRHY